MNRTENLLVTVSEECAEIGEAVSKMLRFGYSHENKTQVMIEFYQLCAMIEMCHEADILPTLSDDMRNEIMSEKKRKVRYYQGVSETVGTLKEDAE